MAKRPPVKGAMVKGKGPMRCYLLTGRCADRTVRAGHDAREREALPQATILDDDRRAPSPAKLNESNDTIH